MAAPFLADCGSRDAQPPIAAETGPFPTRALGKTGRRVPILGVGGGGGVIERTDQKAAVELIHRAYELGVTYFDSARTYREGQSERNYGAALVGLDRDRYYMNTKIFSRGFNEAMEDIERSLQALGLDYVDCLMIHGLDSRESVEKTFAPDGAIHALTTAREIGLTKLIGVSGHANSESLEAAFEAFDFDVAMMAINPADSRKEPLRDGCYRIACEKGIGVVNMKTFGGGGGHMLKRNGGLFEPEELLRYSWSLPGAMAVVNSNTTAELETAVAAARRFVPLTEEERSEMEARARALTLDACLNFRGAYA